MTLGLVGTVILVGDADGSGECCCLWRTKPPFRIDTALRGGDTASLLLVLLFLLGLILSQLFLVGVGAELEVFSVIKDW
jgi:hypothetical protein